MENLVGLKAMRAISDESSVVGTVVGVVTRDEVGGGVRVRDRVAGWGLVPWPVAQKLSGYGLLPASLLSGLHP